MVSFQIIYRILRIPLVQRYHGGSLGCFGDHLPLNVSDRLLVGLAMTEEDHMYKQREQLGV